MKTSAIVFLMLAGNVFAGQCSIDSFTRVGDGLQENYFYTRISTTGWHVIIPKQSAQNACYCTYMTPELQSASGITMAAIGGAPDSLTWDVDLSQGGQRTCINVLATGAGSDNMTYVDPSVTTQEIIPESARVYTGPGNLSPIVVSNVVINNVPYTKFTITPTAGINYTAASHGIFECVIAKQNPKDAHLAFLGIKQEKKGVIYHIWAGDRAGDEPLGIQRCDYLYIEIAGYRLLPP